MNRVPSAGLSGVMRLAPAIIGPFFHWWMLGSTESQVAFDCFDASTEFLEFCLE
jgi:hypothetical protein